MKSVTKQIDELATRLNGLQCGEPAEGPCTFRADTTRRWPATPGRWCGSCEAYWHVAEALRVAMTTPRAEFSRGDARKAGGSK